MQRQKYQNIQPLLIQYSEAADLDMQPFTFAHNSLSPWGFVRSDDYRADKRCLCSVFSGFCVTTLCADFGFACHYLIDGALELIEWNFHVCCAAIQVSAGSEDQSLGFRSLRYAENQCKVHHCVWHL